MGSLVWWEGGRKFSSELDFQLVKESLVWRVEEFKEAGAGHNSGLQVMMTMIMIMMNIFKILTINVFDTLQ